MVIVMDAPWSDEVVEALNWWQRSEFVHPYTCACGEVMIPTKEGFVCRKCPHKQDWCMEDVVEAVKRMKEFGKKFRKDI